MTDVVRYHKLLRLIHWAMALLLLSLLFAGLAMVQSLAAWQLTLLGLHKSFGVLALLLVIIRLTIRLNSETPALPSSIPPIQQRIARVSHVLLYAAMFAMPLSGYLMQNAAGRPVVVFELFALPSLLPVSLPLYGLFRELHGLIAWGLIALVLVHIAAALHHGLIKRDGVLQSMTGGK
ncbi:cytochrome b [Arsukibacterium sp.]|uniref:cytochrome b n=1 Tax=Arsukibacterium sp. TaxID=1977258 RepID=UPI002FDA6DB7